MGCVYLADDIEARRQGIELKVAVKTVLDNDEWQEVRRSRRAPTSESLYANLLERFRREAMAWVRLGTHPNIIFAMWVFEAGGKPHLLMEYADGGDLRAWIAQGRLTVPLAVNFAIQFCEGMQYAVHRVGMVHRDVKPANVLVKGNGIIKIADLGLAKAFDVEREVAAQDEPSLPDAMSRDAAGSRPYMPPEQFESLTKADTRSDVFSFGVMLYEMLTSQRLFAAQTAYEAAFLKAFLPKAHEVNAQVPRALSAVVSRCLEYEPERRYPSFDELAADLAQLNESLPGRLPIPDDPHAIL